jgi:glycolate oxidase
MRDELYRAAIDMGGTISGEHGIGKRKREELKMQLDDIQIELMRKIKKSFDPNNILNPDTAIV